MRIPKPLGFQFTAHRGKIFPIDLCGSLIEVNSEVTVNYQGTQQARKPNNNGKFSKTKRALQRNALILNSAELFVLSGGYIGWVAKKKKIEIILLSRREEIPFVQWL